jgi:hypothetical protein
LKLKITRPLDSTLDCQTGIPWRGRQSCEVLDLRFADVQVADRRLAVMEGKGRTPSDRPGRARFFATLAD